MNDILLESAKLSAIIDIIQKHLDCPLCDYKDDIVMPDKGLPVWCDNNRVLCDDDERMIDELDECKGMNNPTAIRSCWLNFIHTKAIHEGTTSIDAGLTILSNLECPERVYEGDLHNDKGEWPSWCSLRQVRQTGMLSNPEYSIDPDFECDMEDGWKPCWEAYVKDKVNVAERSVNSPSSEVTVTHKCGHTYPHTVQHTILNEDESLSVQGGIGTIGKAVSERERVDWLSERPCPQCVRQQLYEKYKTEYTNRNKAIMQRRNTLDCSFISLLKDK